MDEPLNAYRPLDYVRLSQSVVFLNVCLVVLAFAVIAILRHKHNFKGPTQEWFWLAGAIVLVTGMPWAILALVFSVATDTARKGDLGGRVALFKLRAPLGPFVPVRIAFSSVFRSYVILRYGFLSSCLYEMLVAITFVKSEESERSSNSA
jgi:hypothetical protein